MRNWLFVIIILSLGGIAVACSSGGGDVSATPTSRDFGDAASSTPNGTVPDGSAATLAPGTPEAPPNGNDNDSGAPGGAQQPTIPPPAPTADPLGPAMGLTLVSGGSCEGGECFVDSGASFTLAVEVLRAPASGYVLMQTFIDFGVYNPTASENGAGPNSCEDGKGNGDLDVDRFDSDCATVVLAYFPEPVASDEVVWADASEGVTLREIRGAGLIQHGSLTGIIPPLPISNETGVVVEVQMACPESPVTVLISLLVSGDPVAGSSGSLFVAADGATQIIPFVSPINLHCQ